ncbi:hypothetical protein JW960_20325 [candidate division KSB1 bacterium]|nr:hypothetical protein [candidate division KSB1 bacterium]
MAPRHMVVGIAWFRANQWERLREISVDKDDLETTFEQWHKMARKTLSKFRLQGMHVHKVDVDVEELETWCQLEKRPVDAAARSEFASYKLQQQHEHHDCCNH